MRKNLILAFLFLSALYFSQSAPTKNRDQEIVDEVFHFKYSKANVEILKKKIDVYENYIKNKQSPTQQINLLYAKVIYEIFNNRGHNVDEVLRNCNRIIELSKSVDTDEVILSSIYNYRATFLIEKNTSFEVIMSDFQKAKENANKIANNQNRFACLAAINRRTADYYQVLHDFESSIKYMKIAADYTDKVKDRRATVPNLKLRIAEIYLKVYRDDRDKKFLDSANQILNHQIRKGSINYTSDAFALKAYADLLDDNYDDLIKHVDSSFQKKYHSKSELYYITDDLRHGLLAIVYFNKNNPQKATEHLSKTGLDDANSLLAEMLYHALYEEEKRNGRYKEALEFYEKQYGIEKRNYFLNNQMQLRKFKEQMNVAEKDTELIKLQNNKKSLTITIIAIANLLIIAVILSVIYSRRKTKKLKKVEHDIKSFTENEINKINFAREQATNDLKKQFSSQLHNDVGSILVATSSFLKAKRKIETDEDDLELWDDITSELQNVYAIIRGGIHQIYNSSLDNENFLSDLEKNIKIIFSGQSIALHSTINMDKNKMLTPEIKLCILSTIKEACTNIIKYASAKNVTIDLTNDSKNIYLEISNDNKKKTFKKQNSKGIGLQNLTEKIENLGGNFKSEYTFEGFRVSAEIPLK